MGNLGWGMSILVFFVDKVVKYNCIVWEYFIVMVIFLVVSLKGSDEEW